MGSGTIGVLLRVEGGIRRARRGTRWFRRGVGRKQRWWISSVRALSFSHLPSPRFKQNSTWWCDVNVSYFVFACEGRSLAKCSLLGYSVQYRPNASPCETKILYRQVELLPLQHSGVTCQHHLTDMKDMTLLTSSNRYKRNPSTVPPAVHPPRPQSAPRTRR